MLCIDPRSCALVCLRALVCKFLRSNPLRYCFFLNSLDFSDLVRAQVHEVGHLEPPGCSRPRIEFPDKDRLDIVLGAQLVLPEAVVLGRLVKAPCTLSVQRNEGSMRVLLQRAEPYACVPERQHEEAARVAKPVLRLRVLGEHLVEDEENMS